MANSPYKLTIIGNSNIYLGDKDNIFIFPRKEKKEIDKVEDGSDILIHLSNLSGGQIPGKIYNYSATNKPILFILDGDSERIIRQFGKYNRYVFCKNDKEDILLKIKYIIDNYDSLNIEPIKDFEYSVVLSRIVE